MGYLFAASIIVVVSWSLWTRRLSVGNHWEKDTTTALVLIVIGAVLVSPVLGVEIFAFLHKLTGLWNLENTVGDLFLVAGSSRICAMLVRRVVEEPDATQQLNRWVVIPSGIGLLLAWLCFILGGAAHDPDALRHTAAMGPLNGWIKAYWIIVSLLTVYLIMVAGRFLLILRSEPRHRPVANIYLLACLGGLLAGVLGVITAAVGHITTPGLVAVTIASIVWVGGFAVGAAYSWRRKTAAFEKLVQGLNSRRPGGEESPQYRGEAS